MPNREDYEHLELDLDNNYYWIMNADVQLPYKEPLLKEFVEWWDADEVYDGLFWIGTKLYFTFKGVKYWVSWTFYDQDHINRGIKRLEALGASNIVINYGHLD